MKEVTSYDDVCYKNVSLREECIILYTKKRSGLIKDKGFGLIHIYYGQGVGKTSRTVGLAVRAAGSGILVDFVQFLKSGTSAEVAILKKIQNIRYWCPGKHPFIMSKGTQPVHINHAKKAYEYSLKAIENGCQILICDEILDTIIFDLVEKECLLDLMERCKGKVELVMTGRMAPTELIEKADYVTELVQIKHPYYSGAIARRGIEY
jgi:cob(I)alamin adenosyltransferase